MMSGLAVLGLARALCSIPRYVDFTTKVHFGLTILFKDTSTSYEQSSHLHETWLPLKLDILSPQLREEAKQHSPTEQVQLHEEYQ